MRRVTVAAAFALLLLIIAASPIHGQRGRMMMGHYDPKAEITIQGTIEKLDRFEHGNMPGMPGMGMGIHLAVKSGNETTEVHLGPAAFVEKTMTFKEGDRVEIVGSKVAMMGRTTLIAREIKKDGKVLKLRDEHGVPLWSRMHRGVPDVGAIREEELCLPDDDVY